MLALRRAGGNGLNLANLGGYRREQFCLQKKKNSTKNKIYNGTQIARLDYLFRFVSVTVNYWLFIEDRL